MNGRDTKEMRSGFTTALFNQRGVHDFTAGKEEREFAQQYRTKADAWKHEDFLALQQQCVSLRMNTNKMRSMRRAAEDFLTIESAGG